MYAHRHALASRGSRGEGPAERHKVTPQGGAASPCSPIRGGFCPCVQSFFFFLFLIFKPPYISSSLRFTAKTSGKYSFPHTPSPATHTAPRSPTRDQCPPSPNEEALLQVMKPQGHDVGTRSPQAPGGLPLGDADPGILINDRAGGHAFTITASHRVQAPRNAPSSTCSSLPTAAALVTPHLSRCLHSLPFSRMK